MKINILDRLANKLIWISYFKLFLELPFSTIMIFSEEVRATSFYALKSQGLGSWNRQFHVWVIKSICMYWQEGGMNIMKANERNVGKDYSWKHSHSNEHRRCALISYTLKNMSNLIGLNIVHISDIFNYYKENIEKFLKRPWKNVRA